MGTHVDNLQNNPHDCLQFQKHFNTYGKKCLKFESLQINNKYFNCILRKQKQKQYIENANFTYNCKNNKTWNFYSEQIQIKGKIDFFKSLRQAEIEANQSRTNIVSKWNHINNKHYIFLEKNNDFYNKTSIFCKINHKVYSCISEASKILNKSPNPIKKPCESEHYANCFYLLDKKSKKINKI